jgi:hypothetical protein
MSSNTVIYNMYQQSLCNQKFPGVYFINFWLTRMVDLLNA